MKLTVRDVLKLKDCPYYMARYPFDTPITPEFCMKEANSLDWGLVFEQLGLDVADFKYAMAEARATYDEAEQEAYEQMQRETAEAFARLLVWEQA